MGEYHAEEIVPKTNIFLTDFNSDSLRLCYNYY